MSDDFETRVQAKAQDHLAACNEALFDDDDLHAQDSPAFGPYCGCETCIVREVLMSVWQEFLDEARREATS